MLTKAQRDEVEALALKLYDKHNVEPYTHAMVIEPPIYLCCL